MKIFLYRYKIFLGHLSLGNGYLGVKSLLHPAINFMHLPRDLCNQEGEPKIR
jgi:hypothetical protein